MGVLAQVDPQVVAEGLGRDFLPWALGLTLLTLAVLGKHVLDLNRERLEDQRAHAKEMRELLMLVVPLSTKLTEALEIVERITDRQTREAP